MAASQTNNPRKLNFDKNPAFLAEDEASYLLNHEINSVDLGHSNAMAANYPAAQIQQPGGECYDAGGFEDKITNEDYSFVYNSNGAHYLQRISGKNGVEIVYDKECLQLSADPQHKITPERAILRLDEVYNKDNQGCKNRHGKQVIWTDGLNPIGCIDTEASIATNGFTTPFFNICPDPCAMIQLCVPEICGEITGEFVPRTIESLGLSNKLLQQTFKFRIRHIYYDLRANEWSDISKPFYIDDKGCFQAIESLPRCIRLKIPIGNPMVERIEVAFSNGTLADDGVNEIWKLYDTIEKYKKYNTNQQKWYERELAEEVQSSYDDSDCTFEYIFCNDKECNPIDPKETSRVFNPLPRQPQSILRFKENNFGFVNYIQGNCPVDKTEIEKFKVNIDCSDNSCETEYATVKIRAAIIQYSIFFGVYIGRHIYRMGGVFGGEDDPTDIAYYGNHLSVNDGVVTNILIADQKLLSKRNFTAYIEGTNYYADMNQWKAGFGFLNNIETGVLSGFDEDDAIRAVLAARNSVFYYQEATFKVPKGTAGIIRLQSHNSQTNDDSTSERIKGTFPINQLAAISGGSLNIDSIYQSRKTEIEFDTCGGDVDLTEAFYIESFGLNEDNLDPSFMYDGYVTDNNARPVFGVVVKVSGSIVAITDHNGYYYFRSTNGVTATFNAEKDCGDFTVLETVILTGVENAIVSTDIKISDALYAEGFYQKVKIPVLDCNGVGVSGISVAVTNAKSVFSNANGIAEFILRNIHTRNRKIRGYVMDVKGCLNVSCSGDCNYCLPKTATFSLQACMPQNPIETNLGLNGSVNKLALQSTSLKRGGRYPLGIVVQGDCGYLSAVYELPYIDIPKVQETLTNSVCGLSYDASGITLPIWGKCLKIVRGENLNRYLLQWVVDKIEKTGDGKIILTIQSLNNYNEQYFFKTNTVYQWLEGDRIEFVKDNEGKTIPASIHGILNYLTVSPFHDVLVSGRTDADANYFNQLLIEDDGRIDFLKPGAIIEIQRAKECTTEPVYFQIASIPIVNGRLLNERGTIDTFDTYLRKRIVNNTLLQVFEHHSPSDFWGTKISDAGKAYFVNLYENERRYGRNISINAVGQFNYFGDLVKTMPATQQGDIIAMSISDGRVILAICENDNFVAMSADDLLRVGNNGLIVGIPPDTIIGNPEAKLSGTYGCRYSDIGSIYFGDGYATWYNADNYDYIMHDYQMAKAVSAGKTQSYFRTIGTKMDLVNKTANDLDKIRFSTGFNSLTGAVIITNKSWRHSGINNDKKLYESPNSTLLFNPQSEDFLTMASFTAERYSHVILDDGFGCAFLAYFNGIPYIHPVVPDRWNEFFGVPVDRVMTLSLNKYQQKEKIPLAFELQSEMRYFVSSVETSDPNFVSEIPPVKVKQFGKKWNASFLRNINSIGGLFNGKEASDYWMKVTFVRDNTQEINGKPVYGSIDNAKRVKFDSLSLIFFRFQVSEESGFPEQQ